MRIEIDTGSRLDQSGDTTFAFSNHIQRVLLLHQSVRDECLNQLPGGRLKRELRLFAACVYLLIKDHVRELDEITIDREYPGHEVEIRWLLLNLLKHPVRAVLPPLPVTFKRIGKKSKAHELAFRTYREERAPDQVLTAHDILSALLA